MPDWKDIFLRLQDTVIITDVYGYILDYNQVGPFPAIKKGKRIMKYMKCALCDGEDDFDCDNRVFHRLISTVIEKNRVLGYIVILSDVTEKNRLLEMNMQKSRELQEAAARQEKANAELAEYVRQVEMLVDYSEHLRLARRIHDDTGHAITDLFMISQMGLETVDTDPELFRSLLSEGIDICDRALSAPDSSEYVPENLEKMLSEFANDKLFPVVAHASGSEPEWSEKLRKLIYDICAEGYHNVVAHSMADSMSIDLEMDNAFISLKIEDNGQFHGSFEKGFGLTAMEERVLDSGGKITFRAERGKGFGIIVCWEKEVGTK